MMNFLKWIYGMKRKQTTPAVKRGNNHLAGRFDNLPPKKRGQYPRIAYVLQGGGSLGAYQMGVIKGLALVWGQP